MNDAKTAGDGPEQVETAKVPAEVSTAVLRGIEYAERQKKEEYPPAKNSPLEIVYTALRLGEARSDDWEMMVEATGSHYPRVSDLLKLAGIGLKDCAISVTRELLRLQQERPEGIPWPYNPERLLAARMLSSYRGSNVPIAAAYADLHGITPEDVAKLFITLTGPEPSTEEVRPGVFRHTWSNPLHTNKRESKSNETE